MANKKIITSTCPGGKERMRRLINIVAGQRIKLDHLVTHKYAFDDIQAAYELFGKQEDGVIKLTLKP